jgi:O-antigen/teichoic acid export membrane protein
VIAKLRKNDFLHHGAIVFAGLMLANVFHYLWYFEVSRLVGVAGYAIVTSLFAAVLICALPGAIAQTVVAKMAADLHATGDRAKLRALANRLGLIGIGAGALAFVLTLLFRGAIADYLHIADMRLVVASGIALMLTLALYFQRGIYQGAQEFATFTISNVIEAVGKAVLGAALPLAGFGALGALAGLDIALGVSLVYTVARFSKFGAPAASLVLPWGRIIRTSSSIALSVSAISVMALFDVILVKHYFPAEIAGLYSAASLAGRALFTVLAFVPTVIMPKASARVAAGLSPRPLLAQAGLLVLVIGGTALALFGLAPRFVIAVIAGKLYLDAAPLVFIYGCALVMLAAANIAAMYKIGLHRFDFTVPIVAVMIGEIVAVSLRHGSLAIVIQTLIIGHALALAVTLYRITAREPQAAQETNPQPVLETIA